MTAAAAVLAVPAPAQLLPDLGGLTRPAGAVLAPLGKTVGDTLETARDAGALARGRVDALRDLVRANPDRLEELRRGEVVVRGEIIAVDPGDDALAAARAAGFTVISDDALAALGLRAVTLRVPAGRATGRALRDLQKLAPGTAFSANHIYWRSGTAPAAAPAAAASIAGAGVRVGIVDGGVPAPAVRAEKGFAQGAPVPSPHGLAVASLIAGGGGVRGAAPGAALYVADVYGRDPAGGSALALARALAWLAAERVPVISMSLAGPPNPLLERAVAASAANGAILVAAAGNDGPAAPPAYPASYPGVLAVTGVDARDRALAEAGRPTHLDYAAPGADMLVAGPDGGTVPARGTSYAVPLVAGRAAAHYPRRDPALRTAALDALAAEARDLGRRGPDRTFGRGLICGDCRTRPAS